MQWCSEIVGGSTPGFMTDLTGCSRRRKAAGWIDASPTMKDIGRKRRRVAWMKEKGWVSLSIIDWSRKKSRLWWIQTQPTTFAYSTRTTPQRSHSVRVVKTTRTPFFFPPLPPSLSLSLRGKRVIDPEKEIRIHSTKSTMDYLLQQWITCPKCSETLTCIVKQYHSKYPKPYGKLFDVNRY